MATITTSATRVNEPNEAKSVPTLKLSSMPMSAPAIDARAAEMQNTITLRTLVVAPLVSNASGESDIASSILPRRPLLIRVTKPTTSTTTINST